MNLVAETGMTEAADRASPELERLLELQATCAVLERWPDSFVDEDFWSVASTYFIRIVLVETEACSGDPLWEKLETSLIGEASRQEKALARPNAEQTLGLYAVTEGRLLINLIDHLLTYMRKRWIHPH